MRYLVCGLIPVVLVVFSATTIARKKTPTEYFKGEIILSPKPFPDKFDSDADFIRYMNKADTKVFEQKDGKWEIEYMAFLLEPVSTTQCVVAVYDITDIDKGFLVDTFNLYKGRESQQIMSSHLTLQAPPFEPNRKYLIQFFITYGGDPLAEAEFVLR